MRRIILALAISAIATASIFAGSAAASGPAAPGKHIVEVECAGVMLTISVPRPEQSRGAGQLVGQKGHGIATAVSFTVTDVTAGGTVLFSESSAVGGGHAHPNQPSTQCNATAFEGPASVFFEGHEPQGVEPNDIIRASTEVQVIRKP